MPSYYQGRRDEYGNRDYARRDAYADRIYGPHDERGTAPPEWGPLDPEEAEAEERWHPRYERRYSYPDREDYRYEPELGGDSGYGLEEYGGGAYGYGIERDFIPSEPPRRDWEPPHYAHRDVRDGYGFYYPPPRDIPRHPEELPAFGEELRYHATHPPPPERPRRRRWWRAR